MIFAKSPNTPMHVCVCIHAFMHVYDQVCMYLNTAVGAMLIDRIFFDLFTLNFYLFHFVKTKASVLISQQWTKILIYPES